MQFDVRNGPCKKRGRYSKTAYPRARHPNGHSHLLYYCSARWLNGDWTKWHGPCCSFTELGGWGGVTLMWFPVSGDSRKMNGTGDSGRGSSFLSEACTFTSRSKWDCAAVNQHSAAPDAEVIPGSASVEWRKKQGTRDPGSVRLDAPSDTELINGILNNNGRSLGSTVWGSGHSEGESCSQHETSTEG